MMMVRDDCARVCGEQEFGDDAERVSEIELSDAHAIVG